MMMLTMVPPARAANINWTGSVSTDWFTAGNWSIGAVPTGADNVLIDTTSPNATVIGAAGAQASNLSVGISSSGVLTIQNSGTVSSVNGIIGYIGGTGTVTVTGPGSTWTNSADLHVGEYGTGTLTIQNLGAVNDVDGYIGSASGATGTVTVIGTGSTWTNAGNLFVGRQGTATLNIQNGGKVSNTDGTIGDQTSATGAAIVDGTGSIWINSGDLAVGRQGTGTLTVQSGGKVDNANGIIGFVSGSTGAATVAGPGSTWTNSGNLLVGGFGTGTLTVQNGGKVSNADGGIGSQAGSTGTAVVDGVGSTWANSGALYVGGAGAGTLTIRNGGVVNASVSVTIANQAGSIGMLNIGAASGQSAVAPGTLNTASIAFGAGDGRIVFNHTASNYVFAPAVSGPGQVLVEAGTTSLTGTNTYTGGTTISGGVLSAGSDGNLGAVAGGLTLSGGTLQATGSFSTARAITTSSAASGIDVTGTNSLTLTGVVSGAGALTKTGTGTLILDSANTYTGDTTINEGTLTLGNVTALGATAAMTRVSGGTLDLGGFTAVQQAALYQSNGTVRNGTISVSTYQLTGGTLDPTATVNASTAFDMQAGTVNGTLAGAGALTKSTAGTVTLAGANTYAGDTAINGGKLVVDGSITSSATVNSGGTLTGIGTVGVVVVNSGGTFAPGDGTAGSSMTVAGNLTFQSGSTYLVQVNPATASFASVTGTATLNGASVTAFYASGSYVSKRYTILSAAGGVSGNFSGPVNTNLPANFSAALNTDPTHAYLDLALNYVPPPGQPGLTGFNINQRNVAMALTTSFNTAGGIPLIFGGLTPAGLTQASGEMATGVQQSTFDVMGRFLNLMTDPYASGRVETQVPLSSYAALPRGSRPIMVNLRPRWHIWGAGYGGTQTTYGNAVIGSNSYHGGIYGMAAGADYRMSPDTQVGFALGGAGSNFHLANGLGSGSSSVFQAGIYGRQNFGRVYLVGALAYGWHDMTTDRRALFDQLHARFNANAFAGRLESGYRFDTALGALTPYVAGQFTNIALPRYREQSIGGPGLFALDYAGKNVTAGRSELGLRADQTFDLGDAMITLRGRAAWAHHFNPDRSISASFVNLPVSGFVVNGAAQARNAVLMSAGVEMKWHSGWAIAATFDGEFSNRGNAFIGKGVVRYQW